MVYSGYILLILLRAMGLVEMQCYYSPVMSETIYITFCFLINCTLGTAGITQPCNSYLNLYFFCAHLYLLLKETVNWVKKLQYPLYTVNKVNPLSSFVLYLWTQFSSNLGNYIQFTPTSTVQDLTTECLFSVYNYWNIFFLKTISFSPK